MIKMARPRPNAADSKCLRDALMVLTNAVNGPTTTAIFVWVVAAAAAPPHRNDVTAANDVDDVLDDVDVGVVAATGCGH
jgi:hypothetical protein